VYLSSTDSEGRAALKIVYALAGALVGMDPILDARIKAALASVIETDAAVREVTGQVGTVDEVATIIRMVQADLFNKLEG
jgi:hypothetical protein